jgi:hypothetical protein
MIATLPDAIFLTQTVYTPRVPRTISLSCVIYRLNTQITISNRTQHQNYRSRTCMAYLLHHTRKTGS